MPERDTSPTLPSLKNCAGMIPTFALPGDRIPGQFGPISRELPRAQVVVDAQLVVRRDALGDRDDQVDAGVLGLEDRVGGEPRRHEDHRRVGARLLDRRVEGVEDGDALHVLAALAGRHPRHDLASRSRGCRRLWKVPSRPVMPDTHSRVSLSTRIGHQPASSTTFSAAPSMVASVCTLGRFGLGQQRAALLVVGAVQPHDEGHVGLDLRERLDQPARHLVAAGDAAEDVEQHGADLLVGEDHLHRARDRLGLGAAAGVEEVRGLPPACATTSSVDITSPAPLPRMPMLPSSFT